MGDTLNMVERFINDMVGNADAPIVIEGINKLTVASKLGKAKPVVVLTKICRKLQMLYYIVE